MPEDTSDQGRDDALVANHPSHLPAGHAHGPQHSQLARPLEDGQDQRVHHAEETDDHGETEQTIEDVKDEVDVVFLRLLELRRRLDPRVRERVQREIQT